MTALVLIQNMSIFVDFYNIKNEYKKQNIIKKVTLDSKKLKEIKIQHLWGCRSNLEVQAMVS